MATWLYRRNRANRRKISARKRATELQKAQAGGEIERMLGVVLRPTEEERSVFLSLRTDAQCEARGLHSRARDVLADAERSLAGVDATVKKHGAAMRYGELRLGFLLECVRQLAAVVARQEHARKHRATVRKEVERLLDAGRALRKDLYEVLSDILGDAPGEDRASLEAAYGKANTPDALLASLDAMALEVERWLAREDVVARSLVRAHELTQNDADRARRVAQELRRQREDSVEDPERPQRDTPVTDRVEGRVLFELEVLDRALQRARARDRSLADFKFGAALRRALRGAPAKDDEVAENDNETIEVPASIAEALAAAIARTA